MNWLIRSVECFVFPTGILSGSRLIRSMTRPLAQHNKTCSFSLFFSLATFLPSASVIVSPWLPLTLHVVVCPKLVDMYCC